MLRKLQALLLIFLLLLSGCTGKGQKAEDTSTKAATTKTATTETAATEESSLNISWATAFRDKSLPEGYVTPDTVAFYCPSASGVPKIVNVPIDEILAYTAEIERLPRTHYYEQFMDEKLQFVLQTIDYAMEQGYSRFSLPSTEITDYDISQAADYICATFRMNNRAISSRTVKRLPMAYGQTLNYTLVVLPGMELYDIEKYHAAIDAAREIVSSVPEEYDEAQTALYLYHYLTENVRYEHNDYYGSDWNLLYDTLINHRTVCAGYTEALYYLYNLAGIECITVNGYVVEGYHIWNIARVNGAYYYFDATWDEGVPIQYYQFFGISEEQLQGYCQRHITTFDLEIIPVCDKTLPPVSLDGSS